MFCTEVSLHFLHICTTCRMVSCCSNLYIILIQFTADSIKMTLQSVGLTSNRKSEILVPAASVCALVTEYAIHVETSKLESVELALAMVLFKFVISS